MKHSIAPEARVGGDLGEFAKETMPPVIGDVAFSLSEGRYSSIVDSPYGFHIVRVDKKIPARTKEPHQLRQEVEEILRRRREATAQRKLIDELTAGTEIVVQRRVLASVR